MLLKTVTHLYWLYPKQTICTTKYVFETHYSVVTTNGHTNKTTECRGAKMPKGQITVIAETDAYN